MSKEAAQNPSADIAVWFDGKAINEVIFCEEFLRDYPMITVNGTFFTVNGIVNDENRLKKEIYDRIKPYVTSNIAKRVTNLLDVTRMECCAADLLLYQDRIHVANGTYHLDGTFSTEKDYCRNRLPVAYHPEAPQPVTWLHFLSQLLEPEDKLDDRFVEACQMLDHMEYLADILTVGTLEERGAVVDGMMKEGKIAFLQDYVARKKKEVLPHEQRSSTEPIR